MDGSQSHSEAAPAINWFHAHAFPDEECAASVTGEVLVIGTVTTFDGLPWKVMGYFEGDEYNADPTNHSAPNRRCLEAMLCAVGFKRTETVRNPNTRPHWRNPDLYWKQGRVVTHAWR